MLHPGTPGEDCTGGGACAAQWGDGSAAAGWAVPAGPRPVHQPASRPSSRWKVEIQGSSPSRQSTSCPPCATGDDDGTLTQKP